MPDPDERTSGWGDAASLAAQQSVVGALEPASWSPPPGVAVAGCVVAFARGEQGPGRSGDRALVGAALMEARRGLVGAEVIDGRAGGPYVPGLLAMREGRLLVSSLRELSEHVRRPDALMVDATGRDHPRRCGLAVHLGWVLDVPSVGVTHRLLTDRRQQPPPLSLRGESQVIALDDEPVAAWLCTRDGVRPVVVHAGWRTDVATAIEIGLAREERAQVEGR
jgi:deoxyribonuclease V